MVLWIPLFPGPQDWKQQEQLTCLFLLGRQAAHCAVLRLRKNFKCWISASQRYHCLKPILPHFLLPPLVVSTVLCCSGVQLRLLPQGGCPLSTWKCYLMKLLCSRGLLSELCCFWASRLGSLSSAGYCRCLSDQGKKAGEQRAASASARYLGTTHPAVSK